jgi:hypothetical protein
MPSKKRNRFASEQMFDLSEKELVTLSREDVQTLRFMARMLRNMSKTLRSMLKRLDP